MFQIFDLLTGELIPKAEYADLIRVERPSKVKDSDKTKKEIYEMSSVGYGFTKKPSVDSIKELTADWKNYVYAKDVEKVGFWYALQFAVKNVDDALMVSIATRMHATVIKRDADSVWFQTSIHGSLHFVSVHFYRLKIESEDVFDVKILVLNDKREIVETFDSNYDDVLMKIAELIKAFPNSQKKSTLDDESQIPLKKNDNNIKSKETEPEQIKVPSDIADRLIGCLKCSNRLLNALYKQQVKTIGEFVSMNRADCMKLPDVGVTTIREAMALINHIKKGETDALIECSENESKDEIRYGESLSNEAEIEQEKETIVEYPEVSIDQLGLSSRTTNALKRSGVFTLGELMFLTETDLNSMNNVGLKSINEVLDYQRRIHSDLQDFSCADREDVLSTGSGVHRVIDMAFPVLLGKEHYSVSYRDMSGLIEEDISILKVGFSIRTSNALAKNGIDSVNQLAFLDFDNVRKIKNLGAKSLSEIIDYYKNNACVSTIDSAGNGYDKELYEYISLELKDLPCSKEMMNTIKRGLIENYEQINHLKANKDVESLVCDERFTKLIWDKESVREIYASYLLSVVSDDEDKLGVSAVELFKEIGLHDKTINYLVETSKIELLDGVYRLRRPRISDWLASLDERASSVIKMRLEGKTLEECGQIVGVTRERIRQIESKAIRKKPVLREDDYGYWYQRYCYDKESFSLIFGKGPVLYKYLELVYKHGTADVEQMLDDDKISRELYTQVSKFVNRNSVFIEDEYILCRRDLICRKLAELYCSDKDISFEDFYILYMGFLKDNNLEDNEKLLFPSERAFAARIEDSKYALMKYGRRFRYYPIEEVDIDELVGGLHFEQYKDIEISTLKLIRDNIELMSEYDIRDEYELHNLLKKTEGSWNHNLECKVLITRMPFISFGEADRERQTREFLYKIAPVSMDEFCTRYEEEYGVISRTVLANFSIYISEYYHNGMCTVNQPLFSQEEKEFMKNYLLGDFYFVEDIKEAFAEKFKNSDIGKINPRTIKELGFKTYIDYVISSKYSSAYEYFKTFLTRANTIDLRNQDRRLSYVQVLSAVLEDLRSSYELLEYEDMKFIKLDHVHSVYPHINKEYINEYVSKVLKCASGERYFTIKKLRNDGFEHDIFGTALGDWFASGLVKNSRRVRFLKTAGTVIFYQGERQITTADFIRYILKKEKKMDIYDFINYAQEEYGISLEKDKIIQMIKNTNMYYDTIMEKIYLSKEYYYDEI
ncbi:DNA-directed RNA polymerase subunit alpha C-terminal domain-containing protein [Butyrivibrio sp. NC2007]|uniref:DNA-directed RNA polymerase subunit alpha C-terminal domain-containing protein n=1 Tax=Butyrivibrio sp. NC2007 TaxID=1280683 RepID=UPI0003B7A945|nr:DNA-directed RNA polymerase subunit alpha C-terminal domain-containing protein [Butyrivibrio sp. NC2007]